jgi:hypothetical protein
VRGTGGARAGERRGELRAQVAEIQRARLIAAAVVVVDELGYREATVAQITSVAAHVL